MPQPGASAWPASRSREPCASWRACRRETSSPSASEDGAVAVACPRMPSLRALLLFTFLTVLLTWPLAAHLTVMDAGDSAFFAWEIGWERHALGTDPAQLPHANIFHPLRYTLGLDEPVLGTTLLVLPFAPFTIDAVLLYNLARLLTFLA